MGQFISLYVKKQLRLNTLTVEQREMANIGQYALDQWKNRTTSAIGPNDGPAKRLSRGWAIAKSRMMSRDTTMNYRQRRAYVMTHRRPTDKRALPDFSKWRVRSNKRDYLVTGEMMDNLTLRQVSNNAAKARWTSARQRKKASALMGLQRFIVFSPNDIRRTTEYARPIINKLWKRALIQKEFDARSQVRT